MFSCLQILEAFLWFVLITLLNVTLIILTLSVSRLLNLLLRLVAFLLFLNPQCLASRSEERFSRNAETDLVCRLLLEKKKTSARRIICSMNSSQLLNSHPHVTLSLLYITLNLQPQRTRQNIHINLACGTTMVNSTRTH